jgi:hypothetical protein
MSNILPDPRSYSFGAFREDVWIDVSTNEAADTVTMKKTNGITPAPKGEAPIVTKYFERIEGGDTPTIINKVSKLTQNSGIAGVMRSPGQQRALLANGVATLKNQIVKKEGTQTLRPVFIAGSVSMRNMTEYLVPHAINVKVPYGGDDVREVRSYLSKAFNTIRVKDMFLDAEIISVSPLDTRGNELDIIKFDLVVTVSVTTTAATGFKYMSPYPFTKYFAARYWPLEVGKPRMANVDGIMQYINCCDNIWYGDSCSIVCWMGHGQATIENANRIMKLVETHNWPLTVSCWENNPEKEYYNSISVIVRCTHEEHVMIDEVHNLVGEKCIHDVGIRVLGCGRWKNKKGSVTVTIGEMMAGLKNLLRADVEFKYRGEF